MTTLTSVNDEFKKILKTGAIFIIFLFAAFIFIKIGSVLKNSFFPSPPPKPENAFGKLPEPTFLQNTTSEKLNYTIDTITGALPNFPTLVKVYKISKPTPNLLALKNFESKVSNLGFTKGSKVSDTYYRWTDEEPIRRELTLNIFTGNFVLTSTVLNDPNYVSSQLSIGEEITAEVSNFLDSMGILPKDLDNSKTKADLLYLSQGTLATSTSLSKANFVKVSFFQKKVNGLPIVYDKNSPMSLIITLPNGVPVVAGANFSHQEISRNSSTYSIKTSKEAFDQLSQNKAYILFFPAQEKNILIKKTYLAYFIPNTESDYLLPVIVFEGENFQAFVSAVKDE